MCDPATLGMAALSGIQSMSAINAQNEASAQNRANALQAANDEREQSDFKMIEENRSLIQGGFDATLAGRANEAIAYTSALENGVQGASLKALMRDGKQKTARSATRTGQEIKSLTTQQSVNYRGITTKTQGRINSVPTTGWTLGDTAGVLAPIVKSQME